MTPSDTIVAPATNTPGALAIVRIDGPLALSLLQQLGSGELHDRTATLVQLRDEGGLIDEAIVTFYREPRSFTGNDLIEVSLHGSTFVVARLIQAVLSRGARAAEPGEFTERAVLNGKLDLVQAEAVADLIAARTQVQAALSLANLGGELSRAANGIRGDLLEVISRFEAALDFSDEGYEFITRDQALLKIKSILGGLDSLLQTWERGRAVSTGLTAVILGQPNSGKSTLLNFLCGTDRAIVTAIPGTTRDLLRETIVVGGLPVMLIDTAGLRNSGDEVEEMGVGRAREAAASADIRFYLVDASKGMDETDLREVEALGDVEIVYSKSDLTPPPSGVRAISVHAREGLETFLRDFDRMVQQRYVPPEGSPALVNPRQRRSVADAKDALTDAVAVLAAGADEEIVLVDLYRASSSLGELTGAISHANVISEIFSKFCIGK